DGEESPSNTPTPKYPAPKSAQIPSLRASGMKKRTLILSIVALPLLAGLVAAGAFAAGLRTAVLRVPDSTFTHDGIRKILARESVVLYADGKTRVGTFFEDTHRDYLPYDSIPPLLIEA